MGAGAGGASSGALPQEVREKPARAAIRPRTVTSFIVFLSIGFGLFEELTSAAPQSELELEQAGHRSHNKMRERRRLFRQQEQ